MLSAFLRLAQVIAALVVIRIVLQYLLQQVGVILLRVLAPEMPRRSACGSTRCRPLAALAGFLFIRVRTHAGDCGPDLCRWIALAGSILYLCGRESATGPLESTVGGEVNHGGVVGTEWKLVLHVAWNRSALGR